MLGNYLRTALRAAMRQPGLTSISILSLAIGIGVSALIFLYVQDELTHDTFHENRDRLFLVQPASLNENGDVVDTETNGPAILAPTLKEEIPEVETYVRFRSQEHFVRVDETIQSRDVLFADPDFLTAFTFTVVGGDSQAALSSPESVVITESVARALFGRTDVTGESLQLRRTSEYEDLRITAVVQDPPARSSIQFEVVLPFERLFTAEGWAGHSTAATSWRFVAFENWVLLSETASTQAFLNQMPAFWERHNQSEEEDHTGSYALLPITDIYLTEYSTPLRAYVMAGLAAIILLISCINFATQAIGRASTRLREVGMRKALGALRGQLIGQFWIEAFVLSAVSLILSAILAWAFLPRFNELADKSLVLGGLSTLVALLLLTTLASVIGGSYPALFLWRFRPAGALSHRSRVGRPNLLTRSLVVTQFALSVALIAGTLIMRDQMQYIGSKDVGMDVEHVAIIPTQGLDAGDVAERFRTRLDGRAEIADLTATSWTIGNSSTFGTRYRVDEKMHTINIYRVEPNYTDFFGLEVVDGRPFHSDVAMNPQNGVIVNEALVADFELEDPIGATIPGYSGAIQPEIVGVVKDHHFQSLYKAVSPMMLTFEQTFGLDYLFVRFSGGAVAEGIDLVQTAWKEVAPDVPFEFTFVDEHMERAYASDRRWNRIVVLTSTLAILIACFGLFGLAMLSVSARKQEVGIRKVLGASTNSVTGLLLREFLVPVALSIAIGIPVAWIGVQRWLQDFAFQKELGPTPFVLAGLLAVMLALATVTTLAVRAAWANPADSLRAE